MTYNWTDNPTESGVANYDPDVLNENLMHLKYDNSGGVSKFENLGTVTTNKTLTQDKISVGYWSDSNTVSLPTVTDTTKQVECVLDFTTATTSSPSINQYKALTGTISVTNGSANVTGSNTSFTTEIKAGDKILIASVEYTVSSVTSNTALVLTANYAGTTASGLSTSRKFIRWSSLNQGKAPTAYSILSGVRNKITFKSIWEGGLIYWESQYTTYGGVETAFIQPALTSNTSAGTMGVFGFAVGNTGSIYGAGYEVYKAFNNVTDGNGFYGYLPCSLIMYNAQPLKVSYFTIKNRAGSGSSAATAGSVYVSNDGTNYTLLTNFTNSTTGEGLTWTIPVNSTNFYNYYKIVPSAVAISGTWVVEQCDITAVYIAN